MLKGRLKPTEKFYLYAMRAILAGMAVLIVCTFQDYGITWDEELQSQYGQAIVDYYASFFSDDRYLEIYNLYLYGGMFDGIASAIDNYTPFIVYETRHLVNAIFGLLGLWGTWRLGRIISGGAVGLIALVLLILTPQYYGHMFNNPKDIPFAAGVVWTLAYMAKSFGELPRTKNRTIGFIGVLLGLTLGVRVGGIMTFIFWLPVLMWHAFRPLLAGAHWWSHLTVVRRNYPAWKKAIAVYWRYLWRIALPTGLIAYVVMLACWPWAQQSPIWNPLHAFNEFRHFPQNVEILLKGRIYMSTELPWYYVPVYFLVQLPSFLLVLLAGSFVVLPLNWRKLNPAQKDALVLVMLVAFVPILYATVGHPALYDAVRHFLFAVPLFCVIAALAARRFYFLFSALVDRCSNRVLRIAMLSEFCFAVVFVLAMHVATMIELHPYEYIFVNEFSGGVPGAFGRYELEYWGSSFKEAAQDIQNYVAKEGGVPPGKIYRVAICGPWDAAMIYLPPDYEPVLASDPAEFFLSTTRWMCQNMRTGKTIIRIERMGVPLAVVKDLRDQKP
jgi:hypothetical protein